MTKQDIVRDMKQFVGGGSFITQAGVRKYLCRSKAKVRETLTGLDYESSGRDYKYFIPDVAQRIIDRRMPG